MINPQIENACKLATELRDMTEDQIRDHMAHLGTQGVRSEASMCVVAEYLKRELPDDVSLVVTASEVTFYKDDASFEKIGEVKFGDWISGERTDIANFINHFDACEYPELVRIGRYYSKLAGTWYVEQGE